RGHQRAVRAVAALLAPVARGQRPAAAPGSSRRREPGRRRGPHRRGRLRAARGPRLRRLGLRADLVRRPDRRGRRDPAPDTTTPRRLRRRRLRSGRERVVSDLRAATTMRNRTTLGLVLVAIGVVFALGSAGVLRTDGIGRWWPLLLIGVGVVKV